MRTCRLRARHRGPGKQTALARGNRSAEGLSNTPKVTQPGSSKAGLCTVALWHQSHFPTLERYLHGCLLSADFGQDPAPYPSGHSGRTRAGQPLTAVGAPRKALFCPENALRLLSPALRHLLCTHSPLAMCPCPLPGTCLSLGPRSTRMSCEEWSGSTQQRRVG